VETIQWDSSKTALNRILTVMRECFISEYDGILTMKVAHPDLVTGTDAVVPFGWWVTRAGGGHVTITREKPVA
jgi:hypothetical protein